MSSVALGCALKQLDYFVRDKKVRPNRCIVVKLKHKKQWLEENGMNIRWDCIFCAVWNKATTTSCVIPQMLRNTFLTVSKYIKPLTKWSCKTFENNRTWYRHLLANSLPCWLPHRIFRQAGCKLCKLDIKITFCFKNILELTS